MNLEQRGIPAGFVASTEFVEAANVQAKALGFAGRGVYVPHPIQGRTEAEIHALVDGALNELLALLCE